MPKTKKKTGMLPSGNVRVQVYAGRNPKTGKRVYKSFTASSRTQAQAAAREWIVNRPEEPPQEPGQTVRQCLDLYLDTCRVTGLSPSTLRSYTTFTERGYSGFRSLPASDLTLPMIQDYINARASNGISAKTLRNEINYLCAALRLARPDINPRALRFPKRVPADICIPTTEEVQQVISAAKGTSLYVPILLAAIMGLRRSEICALEWADVDLKKRTLSVRRAIVRGGDGYHEKGTKTNAGTRVLVIPKNVARALAAARGMDSRVTTLTPAAVTCGFERLRRSLGLSFRFHDFRHYHASVMIAEGIPQKYIIADMGHASMDMVNRVYGHIMKDKQKEIDSRMESRAASFAL